MRILEHTWRYIALWGIYMLAFWFTLLLLIVISFTAGTGGGVDEIVGATIGDGLSTERNEATGILELWLDELIRGAPMLIPGAGVVWGILVAFTAYPLFSLLTSASIMGSSDSAFLLLLVIQPILALNVLAHIILMKHSLTWVKTLWSLRDMEIGRIDAIRDRVKPTLIAFGVAALCLFLASTITFIAVEGYYSPAAMHMELIDDGAIEKMSDLVYRIFVLTWTEPDWDSIEDALI